MTRGGLQCPIDPAHGFMVDASGWGRPDRPWWCGHSDHGGNGRFFTDKEAHGEVDYKESDVAKVYESAAAAIKAGKTDRAKAVKQLAAQLNITAQEAGKNLDAAIAALDERAEAVAETSKTARTRPAAAKAATKRGAAPAAREKKEHVEPARFAALRDELQFTNKEMSEALGAAGRGNTLSRMTELTHSKGASIDTFNDVERILRDWRKAHKAQPKPARAEKAAPAPKPAAAKAAPKAAAKPAPKAATKPAAKPARPAAKAPAKPVRKTR